MNKHGRRPRISPGTLVMLILTAATLMGCVAFLMMIGGTGERTMLPARRISETTAKPLSQTATAGQETTAAVETPAATAPTATDAPAREQTVRSFTLAVAGTIYAPKAVRSGTQTETGEYDFAPVFAGLGDMLSGADLAIATMETLTAGEEKGYGNYNAPVQLIDALRRCGVDVVSLGTERALDKGYEGLRITTGELTARGIMHAGVQMEDERTTRTDLIGIQGIQVAVLAYTYGLSDEGKASATPDEQNVVATLDTQRMVQEIRQARADGANVVIVLPHWGTKNKQETPEELCAMAQTLAQAGADVILGTHPNVVQGTERLSVTRADGLEYDTVVCYSLGSLLTDARTEENTAGMVAQLRISYDPATRRVSLGTLACLPVYIARQKDDGQNVYRVIDVENAQALSSLDAGEQEAARRAAERVRDVTGQSEMEEAGQG